MGEVIKIDRGIDRYASYLEAREIHEKIYLATCEFFDDEPRTDIPTLMTDYVTSQIQNMQDASDSKSITEYNAMITALVWENVLRIFKRHRGYI